MPPYCIRLEDAGKKRAKISGVILSKKIWVSRKIKNKPMNLNFN